MECPIPQRPQTTSGQVRLRHGFDVHVYVEQPAFLVVVWSISIRCVVQRRVSTGSDLVTDDAGAEALVPTRPKSVRRRATAVVAKSAEVTLSVPDIQASDAPSEEIGVSGPDGTSSGGQVVADPEPLLEVEAHAVPDPEPVSESVADEFGRRRHRRGGPRRGAPEIPAPRDQANVQRGQAGGPRPGFQGPRPQGRVGSQGPSRDPAGRPVTRPGQGQGPRPASTSMLGGPGRLGGGRPGDRVPPATGGMASGANNNFRSLGKSPEELARQAEAARREARATRGRWFQAAASSTRGGTYRALGRDANGTALPGREAGTGGRNAGPNDAPRPGGPMRRPRPPR
ncbi:MAG: hypothetical protein EBV53_09310 [Proteobacteria bacterium]|nr:hypothetical protein [Pseudomonadota bacterium]